MANGVSRYQLAGVDEQLMKSLFITKQKEKEGQLQTKIQKGEMTEGFGKDLRDKISKINDAIKKAQRSKSKKKWWEKLMPLASLALGPIAAGVTTGLTTAYGGVRESKHAEKTAKGLQKYIRQTPLEGSWGKTFLGEQAADFKTGRLEQAKDLDDVIKAAKDARSFGNIIGPSLLSGGGTYLSGMMSKGAKVGGGEGGGFLKEGFLDKAGKQKLAEDIAEEDLLKQAISITDIVGGGSDLALGKALEGLKGYNARNLFFGSGDTTFKDLLEQLFGKEGEQGAEQQAQMNLFLNALKGLQG